MSYGRPRTNPASGRVEGLNPGPPDYNTNTIKFTKVKDERLLKATPIERKKLIFADNSYNVYVGGVGVSLQRNCRVRLPYCCAGWKALPCRNYKPSPIIRQQT